MEHDLYRVSADVGARLQSRGEMLAVAESCTGGLLAKLLTDVAGSSAWFERGVVTYSNAAKHDLLGVSDALFGTVGAVSEECVTAMVRGLLDHCPADWGVAITGIAGPGGEVAGKPVGTVWLAWQHRGHAAEAVVQRFPGNRDAVRTGAATVALQGLLGRLVRASRAPDEV